MAGVLAVAAIAAPRGQQPTFRARVDLVQIDVVVVDAEGNPVSGLTANDFELSEDGDRQTIATFATVDIPLERLDRSPSPGAEPDVTSNTGREGRLYLIVFDDGIRADLALRTRRFLRTFIEDQMGDNDVAGIAYLGKGAGNSQDFTGNKRLLLTQLDKFSGMFPGDASDPKAMRTFRDVTEFLATIQGRRKAVLYVTTGRTIPGTVDAFNNSRGLISLDGNDPDSQDAMIAAARGNVAVYPINPQGLSPGGGDGESESGPAAGGEGMASIDIRAFAEATGGFAILDQNTFEEGLARIVRENSSYYLVGYYSSNPKQDGRFRSIKVEVKRPGLEVRTRTGYVAPRTTSTQSSSKSVLTEDVRNALSSPVARADVGIKVFAAPYRGTGKDAVVTLVIQVDPSGLGLMERDGVFAGELELAVTATRGRKTYPGVYHIAKLALKPETFDAARREGLRLVTDIRLPAGTYQIRVAAGNRVNRAGNVVADVDVPDFRKGPLALSGLSLASPRLPAALTVRAGAELTPVSGPPPTTSREFDRDETIRVSAQVYSTAKPSGSEAVEITATLRAPDGRVVSTSPARAASAGLASPRGYGFSADLPLAGVAPGPYLVHVEARTAAGKRPPVSRAVPIKVR